MRPTYAEIDLGAIRANAEAFVDLIAPAELCAVVKADGYGHGDAPVATAVLDGGAGRVAVALTEEGIRLREAGVDAPVLVLSEPDPEAIPDLLEWELTPTVYSVRFVDALSSARASMPVHLKVDTGMHRVGAAPRVLHDVITAMTTAGLELEGIWTHFSVADEDAEFTRHQIDLFDATTSQYEVPLTHMANTAGACLFPEARRDLCRIGLGLYGLHPNFETRSVIEVQPAMRIVSQVTHVRRLEAGARPSYGRRRALDQDSSVVTIPIGYADGFVRGLSEYGSALLAGHRYPLAGTITMDQAIIDVGNADVAMGDEVVVLGNQGDDEITADEWAEVLGTISYEIVCGIGPRVPRRYLE